MSESWFYHFDPSGKHNQLATVNEALSALKAGGFVWLYYNRPVKEELVVLMDPLGLDPLSIEDCLDDNQVPKIEDYPRNTFILFNNFHYSNRQLSIGEVDLIIGDNFLVTVSQSDQDIARILSNVEILLAQDPENIHQGPAFLMYIILDQVVDQKISAIEALEEELDAVEETILASVSGFSPGELLRLRRYLLDLRKSLFHEREILVKICRKDCRFISDKAIYRYRDVYDHLAKFFELTETYRDIVTTLMEMYLSMVNNQMAKSANETNATVRRLTIITTIFMPLTLLASIGGMSEWSMMTGPENWRISYPLFLLAMVLLGLANYYLIKWIERKKQEQDLPMGK